MVMLVMFHPVESSRLKTFEGAERFYSVFLTLKYIAKAYSGTSSFARTFHAKLYPSHRVYYLIFAMAPCCAETSSNVGLEVQGRSSGEAATCSGSICHIKSKDHGHPPMHYLEYSEGSSCDGLHHHGYVPTHSCRKSVV